MHEMTFMHSVAEYTEDQTGKGWEEMSDFKLRKDIFKNVFFMIKVSELLTHPKCVNSAHKLLVRSRDFLVDVLVKAWLYS